MVRFSIGLVLPLLLLLAAGCDPLPRPEPGAANGPVDRTVYQLRQLLLSPGAGQVGVLESDSARQRDGNQHVDLFGVRLQFQGEHGAPVASVSSISGGHDLRARQITARGDVLLLQPTPLGVRRLTTREIHLDVQTGVVWSDHPFAMVEPDGTTRRGEGFRFNPRTQQWSGIPRDRAAPPSRSIRA